MKALLFITLLIVSFGVCAQEQTINTDRPTQSASAIVVPRGALQLEAGYLSEKVNGSLTNFFYPNLLVRIGLLDNVELRVVQNYQGANVEDVRRNGFSPTTLGTKVHILDEKAWLPQASLIGQVTLTNGDENFNSTDEVYEFRLNLQNTLSDQSSLGYNFGIVSSGGESQFLYTLMYAMTVSDGWTIFAEPYGFFGDNYTDQRFNFGVIYLLKPSLQFDLSSGFGLSDDSPNSFIGFGAAMVF